MPPEVTCPACKHVTAVAGGPGGDASCLHCGAALDLEEGGLSGLSTISLRGARDRSKPAVGASASVESDGAGVADETVAAEETLPARGDATIGWDEASQSWSEGHSVAGRFRILRFIGQGGMGKVYLAQDETLDRPIALKRIPQEIIFDVDARDDLRQEANRLLDLAHENIVRVHTFYDGPTWPFFAMEYLEGPTLKKLLRRRRQEGRVFTPAEVLTVARQVGEGLSHAHSRNVVHRDLKPANLMLAHAAEETINDESVIKITDFGISRVVADSTLRQTGKRSGTVPYMSPEQFRGEPSTVESDIYSFSCTLYELLVGQPPFYSGDIGYQILHLQPPSMRGVPTHMASVILRGLAKDPRHRFASARELVGALEGKVRVSVPRLTRSFFSRASMVAAGILLFLLVIVFAGHGLRWGDDPSTTAIQAANAPPPPFTPAETGAPSRQKDDIEAFGKRLAAAVAEQLPDRVGRADQSIGPLRPLGDTSITLSFRDGTGDFPSHLLGGLKFTYVSWDMPTDPHNVRGALRDGHRVFEFLKLREGRYLLSAHLEQEGAAGIFHGELWSRDFIVDLTPPAVSRMRPIDPRAFVDADRLTTFDEKVEVAVEVSEQAVEAFYHEATPMQPQPIDDLGRLPLDLTVGENKFLVHAVDAAGNRSDEREFTITRYRIEMEDFELVSEAENRGNVATVRGRLRFEGGTSPGLEFLVNDKPVDDPSFEVVGESQPVAVRNELESRSLDFRARLPLERSVNTVEVRYVWGQSVPRPFPHVCSLSKVKVQAPDVELDLAELNPVTTELAAKDAGGRFYRTMRSQVVVEGRVEPYFDGLELKLENQGRSIHSLDLRLDASGEAAVFSQELTLVPNQENRLTVSCSYRDHSLLQVSPASLTAICDRTLPRCETIRCLQEPDLDQMLVEIQPSEPLSLLRIRLLVGEEETDWTTLDPEIIIPDGSSELPNPRYFWYTTLVKRSARVQVELTDLVGNTANCEDYPGAVAEVANAGIAPQAYRGAQEAEPTTSRAGAVIIESEFVQAMGMRFVPFGSERLEMAVGEVPERAWFRFLDERKLRKEEPWVGSVRRPMVLGQYPANLLVDFTRWFEEQSDDGYAYFIPTDTQWLCAFTGTNDAARAREEITIWFSGEQPSGEEISGDRFDPWPARRYGFNKRNQIGTRPENKSPTGLLDMESNVQEVVLKDDQFETFAVIGGHNQLDKKDQILEQCLKARIYTAEQQNLLSKLTGFRLCRKPR